MKLTQLLRRIAYAYATQPFYIQILLTILFYFILLLEKVQRVIRDMGTGKYPSLSLKHHFFFSSFKEFKKRLIRPHATFFSLAHFFLNIRKYRTKRFKTRAFQRKKAYAFSPPIFFSVRQKLKYAFLGMIFSFLFLFLPILTIIFLQNLPNPKELSYTQEAQTTKIFDRHGNFLYQIYASQNRTVIPLSDVPISLQQATLAIEDKNFFSHPGFDVTSIIRALVEDVRGKSFQGGSTITQQLIKTSFFTNEPSIVRKIKEIFLAFWAERIYTKQQILTMYFNQVPYGGTAWGVEAASDVYFGKHTKELDLAESTFLAGMTAAPTSLSPFGPHPSVWKIRQKEVLSRMQTLHMITQKQATAAEQEPLQFKSQIQPTRAPWFVNYIKEYLVQKYGLAMVEKGGLQVRTSLDLPTQDMVQKIITDEVANDAYLHLTNGATVVTDPRNGDILAMSGGHDFNDPNGGNVNLATSLRQPGSSIKVVTYSAALSHGFTAATILDDSPITYTNQWGYSYSPVNYDGKFHGQVPLRIALANSLNIPAVKTLDRIGIPTMITLAKQMGISTWDDSRSYGLSLTLGAADVTMVNMAEVYGTLANHGNHVALNPILKITDSNGNVIEKKEPTSGIPVLSPAVSFIMANILADNAARSMEFGPSSPLVILGHTVSVKTGTTNDIRDNWTDGFTDKYVVITWVGNNDNTPMNQELVSGITGAAPIWHEIITNLVKNEPETLPTLPKDITQRVCFGHTEYFVAGTENVPGCTKYLAPTGYSLKTP